MEAHITRAVPVTQPPDTVTITMTVEEAKTLQYFVGRIYLGSNDTIDIDPTVKHSIVRPTASRLFHALTQLAL